jgi:hypothetical protein
MGFEKCLAKRLRLIMKSCLPVKMLPGARPGLHPGVAAVRGAYVDGAHDALPPHALAHPLGE